ncbi:MAG: hypothetical protein ABUJ92_00540 [Desulfobacterales bacterium]
MPAPTDFTRGLGALPNPLASFQQGQETVAKRKLLQAQNEAKLKQQQVQTQMMQSLMNKPTLTARDIFNASLVMDKDKAASIRAGFEGMTKEQQESSVDLAGKVMSAFEMARPEIASELLTQRADAARNSGDEANAQFYDAMAKNAIENPHAAQLSIGMLTSHMPGGDKVMEAISKRGSERRSEDLAPSKLTESQAKAEEAATTAKFTESVVVTDLAKTGWDIRKLQEDIKINKANSRISAMDAQLKREGNIIKREELQQKIAAAKVKRDDAVNEKVATVESARINIDNMLNTTERILTTPLNVIEDATGPVAQFVLTTDPETADFEELITNLDAQAFLAQIPNMKGLGALSDAEGKKVASALQNLSLRQSPTRLIANIKEVQRIMQKGRANIAKMHGVPDSIPDTPAAGTDPNEIDALLKKYGG